MNLIQRLLNIDGFGWRCGLPLKDKGSYWRCPCGCSAPQPGDKAQWVKTPTILGEAAMALRSAYDRINDYSAAQERSAATMLEAAKRMHELIALVDSLTSENANLRARLSLYEQAEVERRLKDGEG